MEKLKNMSKNQKVIMGAVIATIITLAIVVGVITNKKQVIEPLHEPTYTVEYGEDFDFEVIKELYAEYEVEIEFEEIKKDEVETTEDEVETTEDEAEEELDEVIVETKSYQFTIKKTTLTFDVIVKDTVKPTIEGETKFTTVEGTEVDYKVLKANDKVDGELEVTYENEVDFNKPGEYKVKATTKDKNGLTAKQEIIITVEEKPEEVVIEQQPTQQPSQPTYQQPANNGGGSTVNNGGGQTPPPVDDYPYYAQLTQQESFVSGDMHHTAWGYQNYTWVVSVYKCDIDSITYSAESGAPDSVIFESVDRTRQLAVQRCK